MLNEMCESFISAPRISDCEFDHPKKLISFVFMFADVVVIIFKLYYKHLQHILFLFQELQRS